MNKWSWLVLISACWFTVGFVMFDFNSAQNTQNTTLPNNVQRIVATAPNITEILFALGLEEKIVGVTIFSTFPPKAKEKPKIGTFWYPDIEAIIAAKPDLVVTSATEQQKTLGPRLERIGYYSLALKIKKIDDLFHAIDAIGSATAKQHQANLLIADIKENIARISNMVKNEKKIKVLYVVQRKPLRVAGRDTFINEMIEIAGGENAIGKTVQQYPPIGAEQIIISDVDVIIEPTMGQKNVAKLRDNAIEYWSRFKNISAVKNKRIYVVDDDTLSQLGPRVYEGIETIAHCLRPEVFGN